MSERTYTVTGMTCGHCVRAVSEAVDRVNGVTDVDVDLESGRLTVVSDSPISDDAVRSAVVEAGYDVASTH